MNRGDSFLLSRKSLQGNSLHTFNSPNEKGFCIFCTRFHRKAHNAPQHRGDIGQIFSNCLQDTDKLSYWLLTPSLLGRIDKFFKFHTSGSPPKYKAHSALCFSLGKRQSRCPQDTRLFPLSLQKCLLLLSKCLHLNTPNNVCRKADTIPLFWKSRDCIGGRMPSRPKDSVCRIFDR